MSNNIILSVKDLEVKFKVRDRVLTAIRNISLDFEEGKTVAIVGESGSGKSVFTKTFTITGNNTTALAMPFTVNLKYNTDLEFAGALAYKLTVPSVAGLTVTEDNSTLVNNTGVYNNGYHTLSVSADGTAKDFTHRLASGSFVANATDVAGEFTLQVYYLEASVNQNDDKNKTFSGRIEVTGDNAHTYGDNENLIK